MNVSIQLSKDYNIPPENHTESPEYNNLIFATSFTLNEYIWHFIF